MASCRLLDKGVQILCFGHPVAYRKRYLAMGSISGSRLLVSLQQSLFFNRLVYSPVPRKYSSSVSWNVTGSRERMPCLE